MIAVPKIIITVTQKDKSFISNSPHPVVLLCKTKHGLAELAARLAHLGHKAISRKRDSQEYFNFVLSAKKRKNKEICGICPPVAD